ncbi:Inhibitor of nuclear factor kappa-B kinase subunit alpha [Exaiptasia diaphana]|nr:Inhibitor of nuclear factor kappa-B kinase subunit alpha [Exaiptasia diaphana]
MQVSGHDDWIEERCLGAGGFGTVTLWKHKYNHEYLAIKKCRLDLSPANRQRWHQEVEILKKLDHANIVKAKDVPAILDVSGGEIPLLAMEYCEGGDLRRILNTPENIRGLKESTVIEVTADVDEITFSEVFPELNTLSRREDINARIYEETGIALDDQVIVSPAGQEIGADSPMLEYIHKNNGTPSTLYLFSKSNIPASPRPLFTLPSTLQSVVTESKTLLPYLEQKRIHAEALSFCYKQMKNYKYLIQAHLTLLKYTLKLHSRLSQLRTNLTSDCIRLEERITFCRESLHTDIEHFSDVAVDLHANDMILRSWREGERNWIHFDKSGVMEAEKLAISAQTQVLELQKIPFNQSQPVSNPMEEIYNSAVIVYEGFKRANLTSYDQKMADCSKIAEVVLKCLTKREKLNKEMFTHLRRILQCSTELQNVVPKVIEKTRQISHHKDHILQIQKQRQEDVWCLISNKSGFRMSGKRTVLYCDRNRTVTKF